MPKHLEIARYREEEVANAVQVLREKGQDFNYPKLVLIGGYALRAYVPYNRATRDCDFVAEHSRDGWNIETIRKWLGNYLSTQELETRESYGYLRMTKPLTQFKNVKISLDIMEGEVRGREEDDVVKLDKKFFGQSKSASIKIGETDFRMYVPSYRDYLILKIASARPSDIRDIAMLLWKNGMPNNLEKRMNEVIEKRALIERRLERIVEDISNENFVDSWRGTFSSKEFGEKDRKDVLQILKKLS